MKKVFVLVLCILLMFTVTVFAGDGGGVSVPELAESSPQNGAENVPVDSQIKLVFSNNISNAKVRDNNIESISMIDGQGDLVEIVVELADDQIEPEKKRDAVIKPVQPLEKGMSYTIIISENLTSKNGVSAGEEMRVTFETEGGTGGLFINNSIIIAGIMIIAIIVVLFIRKKKAA